jgi:Ulp1 family protease
MIPCLGRTLRYVDKSMLHLFTTHFFTTLERVGPTNLARWTMKRGVDVFKKKFIIIPSTSSRTSVRLTSGHCFSRVLWKVNKSLHWSVAVVVNPGAILEHVALLLDEVDIPYDMPFPCILFFDSLKAHAQNRVAGKVREWLNSEWKRLRPESENEAPFTAKSMKIYSPKGSLAVFPMTISAK